MRGSGDFQVLSLAGKDFSDILPPVSIDVTGGGVKGREMNELLGNIEPPTLNVQRSEGWSEPRYLGCYEIRGRKGAFGC
jgi:hypothetical protein